MPTPSASTVLKAFDVLTLFMEKQALSASEAARLLNAPRSSTLRMLVSLREAGVVEETDRHRYQLSMRLFELGCHAPLRQQLHVANGPLFKLLTKVGLPVQLGIRDGNDVLVIERRTAGNKSHVTSAGKRNPLHATASGKLLLAFAGQEFVESYLRRPLVAYTKYTYTDPRLLMDQIVRIRRTLMSYSKEERHIGFVSVARAVRDPSGEVIAGVSLVLPEEQSGRIRHLEGSLSRACAEIEQRLGRPSPAERRAGGRTPAVNRVPLPAE